jgi:hypothetical protein
MGIEAFGIDLASRFATEHPGLRVKFKPPSEEPRSGGAFLYISGGGELCAFNREVSRAPTELIDATERSAAGSILFDHLVGRGVASALILRSHRGR